MIARRATYNARENLIYTTTSRSNHFEFKVTPADTATPSSLCTLNLCRQWGQLRICARARLHVTCSQLDASVRMRTPFRLALASSGVIIPPLVSVAENFARSSPRSSETFCHVREGYRGAMVGFRVVVNHFPQGSIRTTQRRRNSSSSRRTGEFAGIRRSATVQRPLNGDCCFLRISSRSMPDHVEPTTPRATPNPAEAGTPEKIKRPRS